MKILYSILLAIFGNIFIMVGFMMNFVAFYGYLGYFSMFLGMMILFISSVPVSSLKVNTNPYFITLFVRYFVSTAFLFAYIVAFSGIYNYFAHDATVDGIYFNFLLLFVWIFCLSWPEFKFFYNNKN